MTASEGRGRRPRHAAAAGSQRVRSPL